MVWIIKLYILVCLMKKSEGGESITETSVVEGTPELTLECGLMTSQNVGDVQWLFNGELVVRNETSRKYSGGNTYEFSLTIYNITKADRGLYVCQINNTLEEKNRFEYKNSHFLHVKYPPTCKPKVRMAHQLHSSFNLECEVESDEKNVSFIWRYNDSSEIANGAGIQINSNGTRSRLTISFSQPENYQEYYCFSVVNGSEAEKPCKFYLQQPGKPEPPKNCQIRNVDQTSVFIHCTKGFNGGYQQGFIANVYYQNHLWETVKSDIPDFDIKKLKPERNYTVIVFAKNSAGQSAEVLTEVHTMEKDNLTPLITGVVIGTLAGVLAITGCIVFTVVYRKKQVKLPSFEDRIRHTSNVSNISDDEEKIWRFNRSCVEALEKIGEGSFSQVFKAVVRNDPEKGIKEMKFALRIPKDVASLDRKEVEKEVIILRAVPPHSGVIHLFGYIIEPSYFAALLEWFPNGTLRNHLLDLKAHLQELFEVNGTMEKASSILDPKILLFYAHQIASAMSHINKYKCLHRDLATRNIFIGFKEICKIADFGLATDVISKRQNDQKNKNSTPVRWMALESLIRQEYTIKSDVWSFGILCWEILHLGSTPYPGKSGKEAIKAIQNGFRLRKPVYCHKDLYSLIEICWNAAPDYRPHFDRLANEMYHFSIKAHDYILLSELNEDILSVHDIPLDMNEKI